MAEWWTYRLSDFLMFSPEIYWRLVERYNRDVWPLQWIAEAAGCGLLWLATLRGANVPRIIAAALAAAWLWAGWAFHWQRYATINWAAQYLAMAFAVQAVLLLSAALIGRSRKEPPPTALMQRAGWLIAAVGTVLYPLLGLPFGRPLAQGEVFGLMPDPTALATLGLLLASPLRFRIGLSIIPALAFLAGMLTLGTMAQ